MILPGLILSILGSLGIGASEKDSFSLLGRVGTFEVVRKAVVIKEGDSYEVLRLLNANRLVVSEVRSYRVGFLGVVPPLNPKRVTDLNRDGIPEVVFESWSGGAHGDNVYMIWSLGDRPKCRLLFVKGNVWGDERDFSFEDLDGDGIPEIRSWFDGFAYVYGGAYSVPIPTVLKWRQGRYIEATSNCRRILQEELRDAWTDLAGALAERRPIDSWSGHGAAVIRILALAELFGEGGATRSKLSRSLNKNDFKWAMAEMPFVRRVLASRSKRMLYPSSHHKPLDLTKISTSQPRRTASKAIVSKSPPSSIGLDDKR